MKHLILLACVVAGMTLEYLIIAWRLRTLKEIAARVVIANDQIQCHMARCIRTCDCAGHDDLDLMQLHEAVKTMREFCF